MNTKLTEEENKCNQRYGLAMPGEEGQEGSYDSNNKRQKGTDTNLKY